MVEHEGDRFSIQPGVQSIQHRACHGYAKVRLHHGWRVGQHHGHRVALAYAVLLQSAGQLAAAGERLCPGLAKVAMHHGQSVRVDLGRSFNERERRLSRIVGGGFRQVGVKNVGHVVSFV